ncbi:RNA polymerase subunit sigma-70 [Actinoalloteichus fjordicus]|uniref:RNA polymerase sigma factor n=1 Tax=Actinoalloteichus fjordicus TaxID=1612552 RepID=A0AAC9LFC3_9PSEU|nr:RNA polymerase subunit sigma-70 [Actinoalloteichus fjordicus]APU15737.1 RNA polymerase sigma-70 factor, TIGR02960 family [Actinoalloteichus fjordicus]
MGRTDAETDDVFVVDTDDSVTDGEPAAPSAQSTWTDDGSTAAAAREGDEAAFARLVRRHERELRVHCYRMLASVEDAEDLTQETFLRAWQRRETFQGRATFRAWLYRIATNACLDFLERRPSRRMVVGRGTEPSRAVAIPWLQPWPDRPGVQADSAEAGPDAVAESRETIELAFLAAIQHLPPRQRAVLILRDVLGTPAAETAILLSDSVASVNSAVQRARATLRRQLPPRRLAWAATADATREERVVLRRYMAATERGDMTALASLLREDARCGQQPGAGGHSGTDAVGYQGRDVIISSWAPAMDGADAVEFRLVETTANGLPAAAVYIRPPGTTCYHAFGLDVLRIEGGEIAEVDAFAPDVFPLFGLPAVVCREGRGGGASRRPADAVAPPGR